MPEKTIPTNHKHHDGRPVYLVPVVVIDGVTRRPRCPRNMGFLAYYSRDLSRAVVVTGSHYLSGRRYARLLGYARYDPLAKDRTFNDLAERETLEPQS